MRSTKVTVPWKQGLHMLPASRLVRLARGFRCTLRITFGAKAADAASILSLLILGAAAGATLQIDAQGEDEQDAIAAVETLFASGEES